MGPPRIEIKASDGTRLHRWEVSNSDASETVLFVHGTAYASRAVFIPPTETRTHSWLYAAARRSRAASAIDFCGYWESKRPELANASDVPARATDVVGDVTAVLEPICDRFNRDHLVGYS